MVNQLIWVTTIISIVLNFILRIILKNPKGIETFYDYSWPILGTLRYGDLLIRKWFLATIAFGFFVGWVIKKRTIISTLKRYWVYFVLILATTFITHVFSFDRWFEFDDYRVIGHHYAVEGTAEPNQLGVGASIFYSIGFAYLVVEKFGTNFFLWNFTGVATYALIGVAIFFLANKLQGNPKASLAASLFFVTSPTFFRQKLLMIEFIGDGFTLLLFILSLYFLISKFYAGAVMFAAAAMEFGFSRTHFITIPLLLTGVFFLGFKKNWFAKKERFFTLLIFPLLAVSYLPFLTSKQPHVLNYTNFFANWKQLVRLGDMIFGVTIPHGIAHPMIFFFQWLFDDHPYISSFLGLTVVLSLLFIVIWLFVKKKILAAKIVSIGLVIIVTAIVFPTLMGIRLVSELNSLNVQYDDLFPAAPASYGLFSTFGLTITILGLAQISKKRIIKILFILLIILNSVTILKSDHAWAKEYAYPQRIINKELTPLIPADRNVKIIYTPKPSHVLSRYISHFYQLYRIKEPLLFTTDPIIFIDLLKTYQPEKEGVYVLIMDTKTYKINNLSDRVRPHYKKGEISPDLLELINHEL